MIELPFVEQALDVVSLRCRKLIAAHDPARFAGIVIVDGSLEPFTESIGLAQLSAQPPEQAYLSRTTQRMPRKALQVSSIRGTLWVNSRQGSEGRGGR